MKLHFSFIEVLYLVILITSYLFLNYSNGLGFIDNSEFRYVTELHSSGSDDDVFAGLIEISALFFLMISVFVKRKYYVLGIALIFINFSFLLPQMGDFTETIVHGNFVLLVLILSVLILNFLFCKRLIQLIKKYLD